MLLLVNPLWPYGEYEALITAKLPLQGEDSTVCGPMSMADMGAVFFRQEKSCLSWWSDSGRRWRKCNTFVGRRVLVIITWPVIFLLMRRRWMSPGIGIYSCSQNEELTAESKYSSRQQGHEDYHWYFICRTLSDYCQKQLRNNNSWQANLVYCQHWWKRPLR